MLRWDVSKPIHDELKDQGQARLAKVVFAGVNVHQEIMYSRFVTGKNDFFCTLLF